MMLHRKCERDCAHQLEPGEPVAQRSLLPRQERHRVFHGRHRAQRGDARARRGKELQRRGGDDAERAFAANEKMLQVIARVVLAQAAQTVPDAAVGEHHFDAERQVARIPEAQHGGPAGVGRQIAADRAAAFGGQGQRKQEAGVGSGLLRSRQRDAGFGSEGGVGRIQRANALHARKRKYDFRAVRVWSRAPAHAGVAALGDDRDAMVGACGHDGRDLSGGFRTHDGERRAMVSVAPVGQIGCNVRCRGQHVRLADQRFESVVHGCAKVRHGGGY